MLTFNIVALIVGPIMLILLLVYERVLSARRSNSVEDNEDQDTEHRQTATYHASVSWLHTIWRHAKFWISLAATIGLQILLVWVYVVINPFVSLKLLLLMTLKVHTYNIYKAIYSSPYIVLCSLLTLAYLSLMFILTLPSSLPFYHPKGQPTPNHFILPPAQQLKHTLFFHLYIFTWILLVLSTLGITKVHPGIGGGYIISAWNACVALACVVCAIEGLIGSKTDRDEDEAEYDAMNVEEEFEGEVHPHRSHRVANERTPLIARVSEEDLPSSAQEHHRHLHSSHFSGGGLGTWWWIPQFVISVPVPVILVGHAAMLLLDAMTQSLADGASAWSGTCIPFLPLL